ncbi:hypothetical protein HN385_03265 [archaeon]|jgi:hypothetical protein|nr:hypothetical protein [archaeon]MBT3450408.1 hypothetical protein [archaeon]MBT6868500.1 hypothetical protein [archaeon]MBT7193280.1 hypothetical protein [archaeon]MBT7380057.1 hypothetical protein [archaeon]
MTKITEYDLTCKCGHHFKAPLYDSILVTFDRSLLKKLYEKKFNVVTCPKCHTESFIDKYFLFHDMFKDIMIQVQKGEIDRLMYFLDSKGYFKEFKETKK